MNLEENIMNTNIREKISSFKAKRELAVGFLKRHNNDLTGLTSADLKGSDNETDRQIYDLFCSEPDWKERLLVLTINKIPNHWHFDRIAAPAADKDSCGQVQNLPAGENLSPGKEKARQNLSDEWNFQFDVDYFFTMIPYYQSSGAKSLITSQAFAVIDDQLTTQPDVLNSDLIPYAYETPKADSVTGNFDTANPKDLVLYQANDTISLDEINVSSVKEYRTLYTDTTDFFTRSRACDLLKIPGKEQIVTVLLSGTQIGLDVYSFNNGQKAEWGTSPLFEHGIGFSNIAAFDISVSEVLPDNTVEVAAIVSKYQYHGNIAPTGFQTNLIKLVIDVASRTFSLAVNQKLAGFQTAQYFLPTNMEQHIYQSNGFVYLNYMSAENTLTIAALKWDSTAYKQVWKDDYQISLPGFWYTYQAPLLYKNGKVFYFVHVFQNGNATWPFYVEIYQQQDDGTLSKSKTISFSNSNLNPIMNFWGGIYIRDSLYLMQTTMKNGSGANLDPTLIFYQVDEANNKVNVLSVIPTSMMASGEPIMALSNYNIKAQPPRITSLTESLQAVAILDSPPVSSLIDYSNGADYPSLTYLFQQQQSSTKNVETKTDRSQSDSLGAGLKFFGAKIGGSISKKITESSDETHVSQFKLTQNTQITSQVQDMTVFLGITFDIYEYPITIGGKPSGYFLFVVPSSEPHLIINTGQLMFRKTSHQTGNLLSYPSQEPADVQQMLYTNEFNVNADESFIFTLDYSALHTSGSSTTTTTTVNKSLSVDIEFPIIKSVAGSINAKLEGSYTDTEINISSFTIENSFELKVRIQKLLEHDANKYFSIQPYFYIDKANILRCSYRVDVPAGGSSDPTYWKDYYKYPDFGMVMPFHTDPFKIDSKYLLSFDIETKPRELVKDLKELDISATVHNWSLVSGSNVVVGFYYMKDFKKNPSKDDLIEIGRQTIGLIEPRGSEVASIKWKNPYLIQPINAIPIYVIIDPDNMIKEMSKDNNFAQMNYPITSLNTGTGIAQFLPENAATESV
jgi:hypothetical protein